MAIEAVCHECGSLSRGVSPLCENQLCAAFGEWLDISREILPSYLLNPLWFMNSQMRSIHV